MLQDLSVVEAAVGHYRRADLAEAHAVAPAAAAQDEGPGGVPFHAEGGGPDFLNKQVCISGW